MDRAKKSYLFAGLAVFFWSTIPTVFKIGLGELEILPMLTIASITSTIVLFIIVIAGKKFELVRKSSSKDLLISALLGLLNPFIYYLILLKAYKILPAQVAQPYDMANNTGISLSTGVKTKDPGKKLCSSFGEFCRCLYHLFTRTSFTSRKI